MTSPYLETFHSFEREADYQKMPSEFYPFALEEEDLIRVQYNPFADKKEENFIYLQD